MVGLAAPADAVSRTGYDFDGMEGLHLVRPDGVQELAGVAQLVGDADVELQVAHF